MNLLTYLDDYLTADVVDQAAEFVNEQPAKTRTALDALNSVLLAGFIKRCSNEIGANLLFNTIQKGKYEHASIGELSVLLRNREEANAFITKGSNTISQLMPDKRSPITVLVSSYARIRNSSATTLLGLVTPLFMETLARQVKTRNLDAAGLAAMLVEQRENLIEHTPAELLERMRSTLGIDNASMMGYTAPVHRESRASVRAEPVEVEYRERRPLPWGPILSGLLIAGLAVGGYWLWQNYGDRLGASGSPEEITDSTALSTGTNTLATDSLAAPSPVSPSAAATSTSVAATGLSSVPAQLSAYLADPLAPVGKAFAMTDLTFDPATNALSAQSAQQVAEVGKILKSYPKTQLRITGVTGKAGLKSAAFQRANAVKMALVRDGVDLMRLDAVSVVRPDSAGRLGDRVSLRVVKR
jgi:outer membrane protein OmpA-like peptidoglycan-associated protein